MKKIMSGPVIKSKQKKTQLIFFYLKTAKKGMLNILNQCQDRNYVAYCTFYTPPKTQSSSITYTCENEEEQPSEEELACFIEGQPEATIFHLETPSNVRELAEDIARMALKQLKENHKGSKLEIKYKYCDLDCSLKNHPHGSLRYCPTVLQKTPKEIMDLVAIMSVCNLCLTPGHTSKKCPFRKFGCATCSCISVSLFIDSLPY